MSYSRKSLPWVFNGVTAVGDCETSQEVIKKAGLDWTVSKCELQGKVPTEYGFSFSPVKGWYATYRTDTNTPLGIVKGKYTPVQNIDAFRFFDNAIEDGNADWFTAGCLDSGRQIFISAKLPNSINIGNDEVDNYLIFTNSHDGSSGVKIMIAPVRVICFNMLNAAYKSSSAYISFKHTTNVHSKIDIATEILGITDVKIKSFKELCEELAKRKVNDGFAEKFITDFYLTTEEQNLLKGTHFTYKDVINKRWAALEAANISTRKANMIIDNIDYMYRGIGQKEILGTAWGVLNGITGYYSNVDNNEGENRFNTLLYGDRANKIKKATELLLAA